MYGTTRDTVYISNCPQLYTLSAGLGGHWHHPTLQSQNIHTSLDLHCQRTVPTAQVAARHSVLALLPIMEEEGKRNGKFSGKSPQHLPGRYRRSRHQFHAAYGEQFSEYFYGFNIWGVLSALKSNLKQILSVLSYKIKKWSTGKVLIQPVSCDRGHAHSSVV